MIKDVSKSITLTALTLFVLLGFTARRLLAVPPCPEMMERNAAAKISLPYFITHLDEMHAKGICTGEHDFTSPTAAAAKDNPTGFATSGTFKVLAILVQFSDHPSSVPASFFDSLIFSTVGNTVRNFYHEISYTQIDLVTVNMPSSTDWKTAPQTYSYYVNGQNGTGAYPHNAQKMVEDAVDLVDPSVDFSQYDNDHNGYVDVLLVIHSGSGAEYSGSSNDIWSHKWAISPRLKDGVYISNYTAQPEYWHTPGDMTIGVYSHELAHGFGLPDLYDIDYSSNGVGRWDLMSYGTWNGNLGSSPAHPSAWCKQQMGFLTPTNITANELSKSIATSSLNPVAYRLWTSGSAGNEYFLVENRQKVGSDSYLPGSGLLIWHIDENKSGNTEEWYPTMASANPANHYLVSIEQADGLYELEKKTDQGDAADPYPGAGNVTAFNALSTPSSNSYAGANSFVAVQNISASAMTMTADLIVGLSAGVDDGNGSGLPSHITLAQNYPNPFNPTTTIQFTAKEVADAKVEVFNVLGEKVKTLFDEKTVLGENNVVWNGADQFGRPTASGIYFYTLTIDNDKITKKMLLVR